MVGAHPRVVGRIGIDAPWSQRPPRIGKLLSAGVSARNEAQALRLTGHVLRHAPSHGDRSPAEPRDAWLAFLRSIDLLWGDTYPGSALALELRHEFDLSCPAVLCAMGTMPKGAEAMLFPWQRWLRPGDGLLFTCHADQAIWRRLVKESALREWVIPLAVDETLFHPRADEERQSTRSRLGIPVDAPLLLYVGRLNIQKNLHTLLLMLRWVRERVPNTHLCLIGEEDDIVLGEFGVRNTGYVDYLRHLATELGVDDAVRFAGALFEEDLARAYAAADVLVNAGFYHRENFGLSQAEAQACGVPVVCSDWGGFREVILPGETGYFMETVITKNGVRVDWRTGARHIIALLEDPELRARLGSQAAAHARERFSIAAVARVLGQMVEDVMAPPSSVDRPGRAYLPSAFARRYETHKRASGWYADDPPSNRITWYPPMFRGRDYALYETLMAPYATRLAGDLRAEAMPGDAIPYLPSIIESDPVRRRVRSLDPVWEHHAFLSPLEWEVLRRVDGTADVGQIGAALVADGSAIDLADITATLWRLQMEGFIMFTS